MSNTIRALDRNTVVICDSMNYIKVNEVCGDEPR